MWAAAQSSIHLHSTDVTTINILAQVTKPHCQRWQRKHLRMAAQAACEARICGTHIQQIHQQASQQKHHEGLDSVSHSVMMIGNTAHPSADFAQYCCPTMVSSAKGWKQSTLRSLNTLHINQLTLPCNAVATRSNAAPGHHGYIPRTVAKELCKAGICCVT